MSAPAPPGIGWLGRLVAFLSRNAAVARRWAQAVAGTGIVLSAGGFYLQARSLRSDLATLEVQAESLRIDKRRIELEEEAASRERDAAIREKEAAEEARRKADGERKAAELQRAERLFSLANSICTLTNPAEINSRLKLLAEISTDDKIDSHFCLSYRGGAAFAGTFALPVAESAKITGRFGLRQNPILRTMKAHFAVDWTSPEDESVHAPADGLVTYAGTAEGYGNRIVLDHGNGWRTTYSHLDRIQCTVGDIVLAAQTIGQIGATGVTSGRHLHFEVIRDGKAVDPEAYLPRKPG